MSERRFPGACEPPRTWTQLSVRWICPSPASAPEDDATRRASSPGEAARSLRRKANRVWEQKDT